jgi:NAD(P)-dependent dehydrogenase (short-subunit alcohol dehydrogenase family)
VVSRVLITGSSDGLGLMAARILSGEGHEVVLHARNASRGEDARAALPAAADVVLGDLGSLAGIHTVAKAAVLSGPYDAVIHNAGIGNREPRRPVTVDGLSQLFTVNVLAPYLLTALMELPNRLVYLSSILHLRGHPELDDLQWARRTWDGMQAYADSKLFDAMLAAAVARRVPRVRSNAVEPGWVATKMGGPAASDDLSLGPVTQAWLAVSDDPSALVSGGYFYHQAPRATHPAVHDVEQQDALLAACAALTGTPLASTVA